MKFPDLIHAAKMEADRGYPQAATAHDTFWDFISLMPEATHMIMWAMSDRTLPAQLRDDGGFGIHTFRFVNAEGKSTFVKFHWKPRAGLASTIWDETVKIAGADPDFQRRDLFERINRGDYPEWDLGVQLFDEEFANSQPYDVLDATKIIPEEVLPVRICRQDGARSLSRQFLRRDRNRSPSAPATWCRGSIIRTIRCCRGVCSAIRTRRSSGWARPTGTSCRSTRRRGAPMRRAARS